MSWRRVIVSLALAVIAACGNDGDRVPRAARDELGPRVEEIRALAGAQQAEQVHGKLAELRAAVEELRVRGALSERGATEVLAAADAVEAQLGLITTTTSPPPPDRGDDDDDDDDRGGGDRGGGDRGGGDRGGGDRGGDDD